MIWKKSGHPPGIIGVIGQETARYHAFTAAWSAIETPEGCGEVFGLSYDVSINSNECIRVMLEDRRFQWVWIMDDDHVFPGTTLMTLLDAQVDIIVPFYAHRKPPLHPCIYADEPEEDRYRNFSWRQLEGKSGVIPVVSAGKAGVLIRRHVVEKMPPPWFERTARGGEDHFFYKKARHLGFQPYCHLGATLGHITPHIVRVRHKGSAWNPTVDLGNGAEIDILPVSEAEMKESGLGA
jgi:hypothetical protein